MNHSKIDKIKDWAQNHEVVPPQAAWHRIEAQLNRDRLNKMNKKAQALRLFLSIAASFALMFIFISVIYIESNRVQLVEKGQLEDIQWLEDQSDYFYSIRNARKANKIFTP